MNRILFFLISAYLCLLSGEITNAQIKIQQLPAYDLTRIDSVFFKQSSSRKIVSLNRNWTVYSTVDKKEISINLPSTFTGNNELSYEKTVNLSDEEIVGNKIILHFLGINHSAEIVFNEQAILKNSSGKIPFSVELPKDIFFFGKPNKLIVKVVYDLDSRNTIPLKQRFLGQEDNGGIIRDVYLELIPNMHISKLDQKYELNENYSRARVDLSVELKNIIDNSALKDSVEREFSLGLTVFDKNSAEIYSAEKEKIKFKDADNLSFDFNYTLNSPDLWSPDSPSRYKIICRLFSEEGSIVDEIQKEFPILEKKFQNGIKVNNKDFVVNGITYSEPSPESPGLISYERLEADMRIIKDLGVNTLRITNNLPHPYIFRIAEKIGLFVFLELPLYSVPDEFSIDEDFMDRAKGIVQQAYESYKNSPALLAFGVGGEYLSGSDSQLEFVNLLGGIIKRNPEVMTYASFKGLPDKMLDNIDLYGIELYLNQVNNYEGPINRGSEELGGNRIFISEATYPTFAGSRSGYQYEYSNEAQAKYFDNLIKYSGDQKLSGFFINSFVNYRGKNHSLSLSYDPDRIYSIGILGDDRGSNRISYNAIKSRLTGGQKVTIPIGSKSEESPLLFVIVGLLLSLALGLLINSKRKFREDATRALLRPYNFFADIRDHRILSGIHSSILLIILLLTHSLLLTNLLYFFRSNVLIEKILLAFGVPDFLRIASFLAWNPIYSLFYMFLVSLLLFFLTTMIFKFASLFIKTRVLYSNIYFVAIWSILPLTILLPAELVLYQILTANVANVYVFIFLGIFALWIAQRLIKGMYVIFDVRPSIVYFSTIVLLITAFAGFALYFHFSEDTIYFIINSIKQYHLM